MPTDKLCVDQAPISKVLVHLVLFRHPQVQVLILLSVLVRPLLCLVWWRILGGVLSVLFL